MHSTEAKYSGFFVFVVALGAFLLFTDTQVTILGCVAFQLDLGTNSDIPLEHQDW